MVVSHSEQNLCGQSLQSHSQSVYLNSGGSQKTVCVFKLSWNSFKPAGVGTGRISEPRPQDGGVEFSSSHPKQVIQICKNVSAQQQSVRHAWMCDSRQTCDDWRARSTRPNPSITNRQPYWQPYIAQSRLKLVFSVPEDSRMCRCSAAIDQTQLNTRWDVVGSWSQQLSGE